MSYINLTDHEKYLVEEMKSFSKVEWFKKSKGSFGKLFSVPFAETFTEKGVAFTFNILDFDELMNSEM